MSDPQPAETPGSPPPAETELPTRRSLLSRLKSWDEQDSWREFFDTYWRLIFNTARQAGLDAALAEDVVQDTIVSVAREMPDFRYDPARGPFKGWLLKITRRRITDTLRRRYRAGEVHRADLDDPAVAEELAEAALARGAEFERLWDREWETHLTAAALERVKRRVKPEQFQIFELSVAKGWAPREIARALGVSLAQVYLARHRLGALLRKELGILEKRD